MENNFSDLSTRRAEDVRARLPYTFAPHQIVANRFRIVRFIARGGMGEVYEADDPEVGERVALKTIRPEIASDKRMLDRFRREIQLARRVTHPNVCRIFDLFHHRDGVTGETVTFLTMELLDGETLAARIARSGRIAPEDALPLLKDLAAALDAAHAAGVVHRDFKSGNVILARGAAARERERAVVTDFGLSRRISSDEVLGSETVEGTPAYMAPEQAKGGVITAAADVYALGVVMYEMVTGSRPYGGTSLSAVRRRAQAPPMPPEAHVPDLPEYWNATVTCCLQRDPRKRPASASEVIHALRGETPVLRRRAAIALALAVLVVAGAAFALRPRVLPSPPTYPGAVAAGGFHGRRSVAVLGFQNLAGRTDSMWLSAALTEMLTAELGVGEQLRMIPGENVGRMKVEFGLTDAASYPPATLARIRANLNIDAVVLGSFLHLEGANGNRIRLDVRLQDARSGQSIASIADNGDEANLAELVIRCGARLRARLGVGAASEAATKSFRASFPANERALRLYAEALQKLRRFESLAARDLLTEAIQQDANNALVRSTLAGVLMVLGADRLAIEEARKAFEQSGGLSREQQLLLEGRYRAMNREREKAIAIFRALVSFFPDNIEYGLLLARTQYQAGKGKEALATIEELRKLPPPWSQDPQIPLTEAFAAMALADFPRELSASTEAARAAAAVNARLILARARIPEAWALRNLGRLNEARKSLEEAYRIYSEAGDRHGIAQTLSPLAILHYDERDLAGSAKLCEEALRFYRETGDRYSTSLAVQNLAVIQMDLWELEAARKSFEEALAIGTEIGRKQANGNAHGGLAEVIRYQGDLDRSFEHYAQALAIARETGEKSRLAEALFGQGQILRLRGELNRARALHTQALKLRQETAQPAHEAASRLAIARLAIDAGQHAEAERSARAAAALFAMANRPQSAAEARMLVAESLLARQRSDEAARLLSDIEDGLKERGDRSQLVRLDVLRARLLTQRAQIADASNLLESAATRTRPGPVELRYEVQLHRGIFERQSGRETVAREILQALAVDARNKGFHLFARKAASALQ